MENLESKTSEVADLETKTRVSRMIEQAKNFSEELVITVNSSGVTSGDVAFAVANLVVKKVSKPIKEKVGAPIKRKLSKYL